MRTRINWLFAWVDWISLHYLIDSFQRVFLRENKTRVLQKRPGCCIRWRGLISRFVKRRQQQWFFANSSFQALFLLWFENWWGWCNFLMNLRVTCWYRGSMLCDLVVIRIAIVGLLSIWLEHWRLWCFLFEGHSLGQNLWLPWANCVACSTAKILLTKSDR